MFAETPDKCLGVNANTHVEYGWGEVDYQFFMGPPSCGRDADFARLTRLKSTLGGREKKDRFILPHVEGGKPTRHPRGRPEGTELLAPNRDGHPPPVTASVRHGRQASLPGSTF